jgi:hypothetical protein
MHFNIKFQNRSFLLLAGIVLQGMLCDGYSNEREKSINFGLSIMQASRDETENQETRYSLNAHYEIDIFVMKIIHTGLLFGINFERAEYNPYYLNTLMYFKPKFNMGKDFYGFGYGNGGLFFYYPHPEEGGFWREQTEIYWGFEVGAGLGYVNKEIKFIYIPEFKKGQVFQIIIGFQF